MDILLKLDTEALNMDTTEHNETSAFIRARVSTTHKRQYKHYVEEKMIKKKRIRMSNAFYYAVDQSMYFILGEVYIIFSN